MAIISIFPLLAIILLSASQLESKTVGQQQVAAIIAKLAPTKKYEYAVTFLNSTEIVTKLKLTDGLPKTFFVPTDKV